MLPLIPMKTKPTTKSSSQQGQQRQEESSTSFYDDVDNTDNHGSVMGAETMPTWRLSWIGYGDHYDYSADHYDIPELDQLTDEDDTVEQRQASYESQELHPSALERLRQTTASREYTVVIHNIPDMNQEVTNEETSVKRPVSVGNYHRLDPTTLEEPSLSHEYAGVRITSQTTELEAHDHLRPNTPNINQEVNNEETSVKEPISVENYQRLDPTTLEEPSLSHEYAGIHGTSQRTGSDAHGNLRSYISQKIHDLAPSRLKSEHYQSLDPETLNEPSLPHDYICIGDNSQHSGSHAHDHLTLHTPDLSQEVNNIQPYGTIPENYQRLDPATLDEPSLPHEYAGIRGISETTGSDTRDNLNPSIPDLSQEVNSGEPDGTSSEYYQIRDPESVEEPSLYEEAGFDATSQNTGSEAHDYT